MSNKVTRVLVLHTYEFVDHLQRHLIPKIQQNRIEILWRDTINEAKQLICDSIEDEGIDVAIIHLRYRGWEKDIGSVIELAGGIRRKFPLCRIGIESGLIDHEGAVASKLGKIFGEAVPDFAFTHRERSENFMLDQIEEGIVQERAVEIHRRETGYILTPHCLFEYDGSPLSELSLSSPEKR